jgi:hypothetical protein
VLYQLSYTPVRTSVAADPRRFKHRAALESKGEAEACASRRGYRLDRSGLWAFRSSRRPRRRAVVFEFVSRADGHTGFGHAAGTAAGIREVLRGRGFEWLLGRPRGAMDQCIAHRPGDYHLVCGRLVKDTIGLSPKLEFDGFTIVAADEAADRSVADFAVGFAAAQDCHPDDDRKFPDGVRKPRHSLDCSH